MYIDEAISYNKKEHLISHVECCQKKIAPPNSRDELRGFSSNTIVLNNNSIRRKITIIKDKIKKSFFAHSIASIH